MLADPFFRLTAKIPACTGTPTGFWKGIRHHSWGTLALRFGIAYRPCCASRFGSLRSADGLIIHSNECWTNEASFYRNAATSFSGIRLPSANNSRASLPTSLTSSTTAPV